MKRQSETNHYYSYYQHANNSVFFMQNISILNRVLARNHLVIFIINCTDQCNQVKCSPAKEERTQMEDVQSRIGLLKAPHLLVVMPESRKRGNRRHQRVKQGLYDHIQRMRT